MNAPASHLTLTDALVAAGQWLAGGGYRFVTATPATHARVNTRPQARMAQTLRDVFGWSRPFASDLLPPQMLLRLERAGLLERLPQGLLKSRVRFSTLGEQLYAHSAYPTTDADSVFFGPDTYRFADLVSHELARKPLGKARARIVDMGCGGGPGGIVAALACADGQPQLVLADINPRALQFAAANVALAGLQDVTFAQGDLFDAVDGEFDLVVSNPPYLNDAAERTYRHGGGEFGEGLSERIVRDGLPRLAPGGRLVLYTGAAIVEGRDPLLEALRPTLDLRGWPWSYRELDPDVFGEELQEPAYERAERIAAVGLVVERPLG
jgi:methylase of polypeptide subunit release factors